jgi:hypothetical protein
VRLIPVNDLVRPTGPASGYTVIGGGKTAMDACSWLLDSGVPPEVIRWIRPRDAWLLDRASRPSRLRPGSPGRAPAAVLMLTRPA